MISAGVSIVICTYNGAKLMPETLRHLALLQVRPNVPWEIIIVDNASTDLTSTIVQQEWAKYKTTVPFFLLHQPKAGLTFAREKGYAQAQFSYILLCDDDNWLSPDYINLAFDLMEQHPKIGALGGYGELVYEEDPPVYATKLRLFANGHQAPASGKVAKNTIYGAGCVIRKSAYDHLFKIGFRPFLTDRVASTLSSGGDYELCYAMALTGYDIWYDSRLQFKHFMVKERHSWAYYVRYFKESSVCFEVLDAYDILVTHGSRSITAFNLRFLRLIFYYLKEFIFLTARRTMLNPYSDEGKVNTLRILGCKARWSGLRKYFVVRNNFLRILDFTNHQVRQGSTSTNDTIFPTQELKQSTL